MVPSDFPWDACPLYGVRTSACPRSSTTSMSSICNASRKSIPDAGSRFARRREPQRLEFRLYGPYGGVRLITNVDCPQTREEGVSIELCLASIYDSPHNEIFVLGVSPNRRACASVIVPSVESTSPTQRSRPGRRSDSNQGVSDEGSRYGIKRTISTSPAT